MKENEGEIFEDDVLVHVMSQWKRLNSCYFKLTVS